MNKHRRIIYILIMTLMMVPAFAFTAGAASETSKETAKEEPLRAVHKVPIDGKSYCFFVQKNVVLTPEEIQGFGTDAELCNEIINRAGLYAKEANCKDESHKEIKAEDWNKSKGALQLSADDVTAVRGAFPEEGAPIKMYMDVTIARKTASDQAADDEEQPYTTYRKIAPEIIFIAVATEEDAKSGDEICEEPEKKQDAQPAKKAVKLKTPKLPKLPKVSTTEEDMLPELRTINMADRSGPPVEDTLKDGSPVSLEWIEPGRQKDNELSFIDRIPGGYIGLAAAAAVLIGLLAALIAVMRRRREDEDY